jgi:hypothetical protein
VTVLLFEIAEAMPHMAESSFEQTEPVDSTVPPFTCDRPILPRLRLHHRFAVNAAMALLIGISGPRYDFGEQSVAMPQFLTVI